MIPLILCLLQITLIAAAALGIARIVMHRDPAFAAKIVLGGIALSCVAVMAYWSDLPRPWSLAKHDPAIHTRLASDNLTPATTGLGDQAQTIPAATALHFQPGVFFSHLQSISVAQPEISQAVTVCRVVVVAISLIVLLRCCLGSIALRELWRRSCVCELEDVNFELERIKARLSLSSDPVLRTSSAISTPCVSWLSPGVIFVPTDIGAWSKYELRASLAHELAHIQRRDALWRFLAELCLAPMLFHPLAVLLRKQLVFAQELATDYAASQLFENSNHYRKGLSMLALRMDSQCDRSFPFQVSVSTNNLVRRIKMLNRPLHSLLRWQAFVVAGSFALGGFGLLAWKAQADDPVRLASHSNKAASVFNKNHMKPWDVLGDQRGYWCLSGDLGKNAFWANLWDAYSLEIGISNFDHNALGLNKENVSFACTDLQVGWRKVPEEQRKDPNKEFEGTISASSFSVTTRDPVDWAAFGDALLDAVDMGEQVEEWLGKLFEEQGTANEFNIVSNSVKDQAVANCAALKATCNLVNGGVFMAGTLVPVEQIKLVMPSVRQTDDPVGIYGLLQNLQAIAVGVDVGYDARSQYATIALLPQENNNIEDLAEQAKKVFAGSLQILEAVPSAEKEVNWAELGKALSSPSVEVVDSGLSGGQAILVRFQTNVELWTAMNLDTMVQQAKGVEKTAELKASVAR